MATLRSGAFLSIIDIQQKLAQVGKNESVGRRHSRTEARGIEVPSTAHGRTVLDPH